MDSLDEEKRAHDTNMQNILAQLEPARLQFSHLQRTLEALKENCQKTNTFSAGAFDKVSQLSKEIQKQNELIFNIEQKCAQLGRAETARYQKKRSDLWMALLPAIEQKNDDYKSFTAKRYAYLQALAREMNRAKNTLQKIKNNRGDDSADIITIDGSPPSKCAKTNSFLAKSSAHQTQNNEASEDNGENEKIKRGRLSQCCAGGDVHTQQMKAEFEELQKPPKEYTKELINATDQKTREAFLDNTMPFNNTFAFASVHGEKAPDDQMGGRLDTCKYNGEFSFQFSDLIAPGGRRPTFAQVYTLTPEAAINIRDENFSTALSPPVKAEILKKLEELMRANPFGRTFETAGAKIEAAKAATGEIPRFQIALLTDRDLKTDALKNRGDVTIIERADAPTAKQVAVIWVQEDGLAPEISAFWVCDKAGRMRELKSGMPQLDPCCFPLLHPRGTPGWRWFIKKRGRMLTREEREEVQMQDALDNAMAEEVAEPIPNELEVGASEHQEGEEMPEEALELDEEVLEEEENNACREEDPVDFYDSRQFGEADCEHCGALMLKGEHEKMKGGRLSQCCAGGDVHTPQMKAEFEELQNPPAEYIKGLINSTEQKTREAFLDNTMPFNNTFAFASVHGEKAPEDQMGGRLDTCKYNGEFSFQFSDLIAPGGRRPTFAQVYTLTPEAAMNIRDDNLTTALSAPVKAEIVRKLEELMRANPFGRTFETAGAKIEAAKSATGEIPRFQIALLTDRDLKTDALKNRGDVTIIERADAPTAKQVAVIWVQEDGLAPEISAFWVCDKAGRMRKLKSGMPQLDPCCFPLLHPRGTPGWRWFIKKRGRMLTREEREEVQMQDALDNSMAEKVVEQMPNEPDVGTSEHQEGEEMPEEALELDEEVLEEEENNACREEDPVMEPENIDGSSKKSNISERQFYRYRMALRGDDKNAFHWLWFARRLAEYFTISVLNRIERNEMDHLKAIQSKKNYRQLLARDYIAAMEKGLQKLGRNAKLGRVFLMPQTFAGSRQYYQGKYADLMTMVRHLGAPTWFVTFTGNPKWPEIAEALRGRQNYAHRPDIVCRIFMDKATEFIKDLTERHVLGKVAGWCYSVEHQKRGMPHIHMLLILDKRGRIVSPEQVDEYVSARIPPLPPIDDHSPEAKQQRRLGRNAESTSQSRTRTEQNYQKSVTQTTFVYHPTTLISGLHQRVGTLACRQAKITCLQTIQKGTGPKSDTSEYRTKAEILSGSTKGGRNALLLDDSRVIPYNAFLLLKFGTHINIEYVFGQKACKYIFKYLLKGFEKAYVRVIQPRKSARRQSGDATEDVYDYDEIAATFKVRYMTAMEAYLRLHSYKIVGTSHQIYTLSVHDEGGHTIVVEEGQEEEGQWKVDARTRLTGFFKLCGDDATAAQLTYDRVPYYYSWNYKAREWKKRGRPLSEDVEKARMFVRVYTVSPRKHELFAIRLLLLHRPGPKSFEHLRTIDGVLFPTFAGAAQHLGLLESDVIFRRSMREACAEKSNFKQLQHYFAMLLCHARPAEPQELFDEFLDEMNPPFAANNPAIRPK
uniref:Helitron_like_N domain-containing protein n=1 Tax=Globodera pallida TaxID=36090 RepID=A0A183C067_GLOPA